VNSAFSSTKAEDTSNSASQLLIGRSVEQRIERRVDVAEHADVRVKVARDETWVEAEDIDNDMTRRPEHEIRGDNIAQTAKDPHFPAAGIRLFAYNLSRGIRDRREVSGDGNNRAGRTLRRICPVWGCYLNRQRVLFRTCGGGTDHYDGCRGSYRLADLANGKVDLGVAEDHDEAWDVVTGDDDAEDEGAVVVQREIAVGLWNVTNAYSIDEIGRGPRQHQQNPKQWKTGLYEILQSFTGIFGFRCNNLIRLGLIK